MNKRLNTTAQGGFTLIELIVVIVILGILAATALPKFTNLSGDARFASLNAVRGSVNSVVAMAHGRALLNASGTGTVDFEGTSVTLANGYPAAAQELFKAAGLNIGTDYNYVGSSSSGDKVPTTSDTQVAVVPTALVGTTTAAGCYVRYTPALPATASAPITPPVVEVVGTAASCM
jgi:MSHA pilin protein MshA